MILVLNAGASPLNDITFKEDLIKLTQAIHVVKVHKIYCNSLPPLQYAKLCVNVSKMLQNHFILYLIE